MTEFKKKLLKQLHDNGCTDSDIEDFCEKYGVKENEAFHYVAELIAPPQCKGCKHVDFFRNLYPCNDCSRAGIDHYEASPVTNCV